MALSNTLMYEYLHILCLLLVSAEFAIIRQNISNIKIIVVIMYVSPHESECV
jgi:hypothetical protein